MAATPSPLTRTEDERRELIVWAADCVERMLLESQVREQLFRELPALVKVLQEGPECVEGLLKGSKRLRVPPQLAQYHAQLDEARDELKLLSSPTPATLRAIRETPLL